MVTLYRDSDFRGATINFISSLALGADYYQVGIPGLGSYNSKGKGSSYLNENNSYCL
jgi:hypothetical protein